MVKPTWLEVSTMFTPRLRPSHRNLYLLHKFTRFPFWTEAHQVVHTDHPSCVSVSAVRTWDRRTDKDPNPKGSACLVFLHNYWQGAGLTVFAEASIIPGAVFDFGFGINVQERAFLVATLACEGQHGHKTVKECTPGIRHHREKSVNPRTKLGVEVTFRHLGHVVLMEKLALVSLLTQSSEPVLTHHRLLSTDVPVRTHPTWEWTQKVWDNVALTQLPH